MEYFKKLSQNLKPDGKIAIIDYKPMGTFSFTDLFKHNTPKEVILKEMGTANVCFSKARKGFADHGLLGVCRT